MEKWKEIFFRCYFPVICLREMYVLLKLFRSVPETFEMLKALYDFEAVYPKTISFLENEFFILHQTTSRYVLDILTFKKLNSNNRNQKFKFHLNLN